MARKERLARATATCDLGATTGHVCGERPPVGMKGPLPALVDEAALLFDQVGISGGHRGLSLRVGPPALAGFLDSVFTDITGEA